MKPFRPIQCKPCEQIGQVLSQQTINAWIKSHPHWSYTGSTLKCDITFENYFETMAVVNAIAFIAHQENHHPDMHVSYNHLVIELKTHSLNGITENDLFLAEKIQSTLHGDDV